MNQGLGQLDALAHSEGVGRDLAVALVAEADVVQDLVRGLERVVAGHAAELAAVGHEGDRAPSRAHDVVLGDVADPLADLEEVLRNVEAQDLDRPALGPAEAHDRAEERALAGAVGPQEPDRPRPERELLELEGHEVPVGDLEVLDLQDLGWRNLGWGDLGRRDLWIRVANQP